MYIDELSESFEMSRVEMILKELMAERDDLTEKALSSDELTAYVGWIIERYSQKYAHHAIGDLPAFNNRTDIASFTKELSENLTDAKLSHGFPKHWLFRAMRISCCQDRRSQ